MKNNTIAQSRRQKTVVTYGPSLADFVMLTGAQMDALIVLLVWSSRGDVPVTSSTTKLTPGQVNARAVTALTRQGMTISYDADDGTPMAAVTHKAYGAIAHMPTLELAVTRARERLARGNQKP